ncbi:MAG: AAA family ATPase [Acetobacteraceae bacterium]|nr:AAA family ATPase [Acetobacteraceae bacterium]
MSRLIAVASGKGGVGKTVLAIGLAQALAEAGRDVLLADADPGLANVDVQLGLAPPRDVAAVLAGQATVAEAALRHEAGFRVLAGRSGGAGLAALEGKGAARLPALLRAAAGDALLDLGAGIGPVARRLAAAADLLLVIVTDQPTSLTDAYAVLKLHRRDAPGRSAGVVVNDVPDAAVGARVHATLDTACRRFLGGEAPLLGTVRRDPRVPAAIRAQVPLLTRHPDAPAARDIRALAQRLLAGGVSTSVEAAPAAWSRAASRAG